MYLETGVIWGIHLQCFDKYILNMKKHKEQLEYRNNLEHKETMSTSMKDTDVTNML